MPNLSITWTPGIGAIEQRIQSLDLTASFPIWIETGFVPPNPLGPTVNSAVRNVPNNRVHRFRVRTICPSGENPYSNLNDGIAFGCVPIAVTETEGNSSFTVTATLGTSSIKKVRFVLYNSTGTTLVETSPEVLVGGTTVSHTFSQPLGVDYQISTILYADLTIDGVVTEVTSNIVDICKQVISPETGTMSYYARLEYDGEECDCYDDALSVTQVFCNYEAYIRVYSDPACTIPISAPVGAEVNFDVFFENTVCEICEPKVWIGGGPSTSNKTLVLNTGSYQTLVPHTYKPLGLESQNWKDCTGIYDYGDEEPCDGGGGGGGFLCSVTAETSILEIINLTSTGTSPVIIV